MKALHTHIDPFIGKWFTHRQTNPHDRHYIYYSTREGKKTNRNFIATLVSGATHREIHTFASLRCAFHAFRG